MQKLIRNEAFAGEPLWLFDFGSFFLALSVGGDAAFCKVRFFFEMGMLWMFFFDEGLGWLDVYCEIRTVGLRLAAEVVTGGVGREGTPRAGGRMRETPQGRLTGGWACRALRGFERG